MRPICVSCQRFFKPIKNGFDFIEAMPLCDDAQPGNVEPDKWTPYKLWSGDKWRCPSCNVEIVVGVGQRPIAEHYQHNFEQWVESLGAVFFQVNDC
jgi:hypothetical protein